MMDEIASLDKHLLADTMHTQQSTQTEEEEPTVVPIIARTPRELLVDDDSIKRRSKLYDLVVVGILAWVTGSAWNYTVVLILDGIANKSLKIAAWLIWCVVITMLFALVIWFSV